jgi:hypothetical protein
MYACITLKEWPAKGFCANVPPAEDSADSLSASCVIGYSRLHTFFPLLIATPLPHAPAPAAAPSSRDHTFSVAFRTVQFLLLLCKVCDFRGGDYEEWCLLGCYSVWLL